MKNAYEILGVSPEKNHFGGLELDERIICKLFLNSERSRRAGLTI
jgi:hypothetical protein